MHAELHTLKDEEKGQYRIFVADCLGLASTASMRLADEQ
jgi:hypothetical protein